LRLYESQLDWAVQKFPNTCGVSLRVDKALAPPEQFSAMPLLGLGAENAPVRLIADWIARQTTSFASPFLLNSGNTSASVSRVRRAEEQSTRLGSIPCFAMARPIIGASAMPRALSGRS
jgi:hypothetical protein